MAIEVNGDSVSYAKGETVSELLRRMNYVFPLLVVVINGERVPEAEFGSRKIKDGARIEVVHLTSGG